MQKTQDWLTQLWVKSSGRRVDPQSHAWLMGPIGEIGGIGENVVYQIAEKEGLVVQRECTTEGLLPSIHDLGLSAVEAGHLHKEVVDFYEHTAQYHLALRVWWMCCFKVFAKLLNLLFSKRLDQLNLPQGDMHESVPATSEIIRLLTPEDRRTNYTFWLRKYRSNGRIIYSGIYDTCTLTSGETCIKVIFPLPNGSATVLMKPTVGADGELILTSAGRSFGDPGFYFILRDARQHYWSRYVPSFRDTLTIRETNGLLTATQSLRLGMFFVAEITYSMKK